MSVEITIKQKGLLKKKLCRDVILGDKLSFGYFDGVRLGEYEEAMDPNDIIVYNPNCIGRGFTVDCDEEETKEVYMRLLYPTSSEEINDFVDCALRITKAWRGNVDIDMDGEETTIEDINNSRDMFRTTSLNALEDWSQDILKEEEEIDMINLFCAMWSLSVGKKEAAIFANEQSLDSFRDYMHEKQNIDAFYPKPMFYKDDKNSIIGRYVLSEEVTSIFPLKPVVPYGFDNPETEEQLEIDQWFVAFYSFTEKDLIAEIDYEKAISLIPENKKEYYDASSILIDALSLNEIKDIIKNHTN